MVLVEAHVFSVLTKIVQLYEDRHFVLVNLQKAEYLNPQETYLLHASCVKEHRPAEK